MQFCGINEMLPELFFYYSFGNEGKAGLYG